MFHRMFGRRKSPEEENADSGIEATEEKAAGIVNSDLETNETPTFNPPSGYTVGGANAFLPYTLDPSKRSENAYQRSLSSDAQTAIDGIPFKLGSNVLLEGSQKPQPGISTDEIMERIKSFNWDEYEYSFELERSIMREFHISDQKAT